MMETVYRKAILFTDDAHRILSGHEAAVKSRTIMIEQTYDRLTSLSVKQDDLFRQALRCIENELYRAAHVMAWSGFMDFIEEKGGEDGYAKVREIRRDNKIQSAEDLRDSCGDFQIIECLKRAGVAKNSDEKALKGLLNKRNECAHPSDYYPNLNDTLGYFSEILQRLEYLRKRSLVT
jgi:hypothetical protein